MNQVDILANHAPLYPPTGAAELIVCLGCERHFDTTEEWAAHALAEMGAPLRGAMLTGRELYALHRALEANCLHAGAVALYEKGLAEWDGDAQLRADSAPDVTDSWGWWAEKVAATPPRCATCRWAQAVDAGLIPTGATFYPLACGCAGEDEDDRRARFTGWDFGDDVSSNVLVAPDFGCWMWEAKP